MNADRAQTAFFTDDDLVRDAARDHEVSEVTILAHSMGAWLAAEALRGIAMRDGRIPKKITDVVFASPDIDIDVFRRQFVEMGSERPRFTVFATRRDKALGLSRWLAGDIGRLGTAGEMPSPAVLQALGVTVVDTSDVPSTGPLRHTDFADRPEVVRLLARRLIGAPIGAEDKSMAREAGMTVLGAVDRIGGLGRLGDDGDKAMSEEERTILERVRLGQGRALFDGTRVY